MARLLPHGTPRGGTRNAGGAALAACVGAAPTDRDTARKLRGSVGLQLGRRTAQPPACSWATRARLHPCWTEASPTAMTPSRCNARLGAAPWGRVGSRLRCLALTGPYRQGTPMAPLGPWGYVPRLYGPASGRDIGAYQRYIDHIPAPRHGPFYGAPVVVASLGPYPQRTLIDPLGLWALSHGCMAQPGGRRLARSVRVAMHAVHSFFKQSGCGAKQCQFPNWGIQTTRICAELYLPNQLGRKKT